MARCELTMTIRVHTRFAWAVAYALMPAIFLGLMSERRATDIAARFIRVTTKIG